MVKSASQPNGTAYPFNIVASAVGSTFVRYCFYPGYSYRPTFDSTIIDIGGGTSNGTANNLGTAFYYPIRNFGAIHLDNPNNYNPGAGKTILTGVATTDSFTAIICFEHNAANLQYGADIVMGAYNNSTHDWWFGLNSSTKYQFSANGVANTTTISPVQGRKYIAMFANKGTSPTDGWYWLLDSDGNEASGTRTGVALSTAGTIGIGKYGNFVDNYMPNIYVYDFLHGPYIASGYASNLIRMFKNKFGFSTY